MSHEQGGSVLLADYPKAARRETEEEHSAVKDMIEQFTLMVAQIDFPITATAPAAGVLTATVIVQARDANDVRSLFGDNVAGRVQVDANGGGAAGDEISADGVNWGATAILSFKRGEATLYARATGTGTQISTLVDIDGTGLTLGGDNTITYS
jgi:hypothetical protein